MISGFLRKKMSKHFTGESNIQFQNKIPGVSLIQENFNASEKLGIYLHIPFCNQICSYCPYNKEIFKEEACQNYIKAVKKEVDFYAPLLNNKPITSVYIGGGTPTTMIGKGIEEMINHIYKQFNIQCHIHMESHPNHLTQENLNAIEAIGVKYLSIGVEALQDRHLKVLGRPYTVNEVKQGVERAVGRNFECVNIDYIFDLPGQTVLEVEHAAHEMVDLGIQQVATYPLFRFPYTRLGKAISKKSNAIATMFRRRKFLKILEDIFYDSGFERSSVWAFTKKGVDKYCSVTVPSYLGLGASGSSYLKNIFYVNTFNVAEYNNALANDSSPIALSIDLSEKMQMAGWLYWRIYETNFKRSDFEDIFNKSFNKQYGSYIKLMNKIGFLKYDNDQIILTDKGTYWIHAFEDFFSIDYISKLWGTSKFNPWPEKVIL
jgi:oxygen-independent coproporphyrinogen-3 oxidase